MELESILLPGVEAKDPSLLPVLASAETEDK